MKEYLITALAGREVAGIRNPGINETVHLTPLAAEHALRLGHIVSVPEKATEAEKKASEKPRTSTRGRKRK
jgi:hypothetical protein